MLEGSDLVSSSQPWDFVAFPFRSFRCISHMRDSSEVYVSDFEDLGEFESHLTRLESDEIRPGEVEIRALCRLYNVSLHLFKEVNAEPIVFNKQVPL